MVRNTLLASLVAGVSTLLGAPGCQSPPGKDENPVHIDTVAVGDVTTGVRTQGCSGVEWHVRFRLDNPATVDGYLVQQVHYTLHMAYCDGTAAIDTDLTWWEAWWISAGHSEPALQKALLTASDDTFQVPQYEDTKGALSVDARIKFFAMTSLPPDFTVGDVRPAFTAPATWNQPAFWTTDGATLHELDLTWDCCTTPHTHSVKTTPEASEVSLGPGRVGHGGLTLWPVSDDACRAVLALIESGPTWERFTEADAESLRSLARKLIAFNTDELRLGFYTFARKHKAHVEDVPALEKAFLLLRAIFDLPRAADPRAVPAIGAWVGDPARPSEAWRDLSWPLGTDERGRLVLKARYRALLGEYDPGREFDAFDAAAELRKEVK